MRLKCIYLVLILTVNTYAGYEVEITLKGGSKFSTSRIDIIGDKLVCNTKKIPIQLNLIQDMNVTFDGINVSICESLFKNKRFIALEGLLEEELSAVRAASNIIKNNLGPYYLWLLRAQIWNEHYIEARETIGILSHEIYNKYDTLVSLYSVFLLLETNNINEAKRVFSHIKSSEIILDPMYNYLKGRIAFEQSDIINTHKYLSQVIAYNNYDSEWTALALLLEAELYILTDKKEIALSIIDEIKWIYPDLRWDKKARDLINK